MDDPAPYYIEPQDRPPAIGPQHPYIELPDRDREQSKQAVSSINVATAIANAVVREAATICDREHEQLARDLGLDRPRPGFV